MRRMFEYWRVFLGAAVMLLVWWRLSQKPITLNLSEGTAVDAWEPPLVSDVLPTLAVELRTLLVEQNEPELAAQIPGLRIVDRCRCGDGFCATFYVRPKPMVSCTIKSLARRPRDSTSTSLTPLFRFSWKWRKRSPVKIMERTHEEATEALRAARESRHPEEASAGAGADLGAV